VSFCLRKVIAPIQRIKPSVKKEARKVALPEYEAPYIQVLRISGDYEVYILRAEMRKGLDYAIRRDNGDVPAH
jgi:hypothetical protein